MSKRENEEVTPEVGSEGGSPGDVEIETDRGVGTGREADETWRPSDRDVEHTSRDETGEGRRSP